MPNPIVIRRVVLQPRPIPPFLYDQFTDTNGVALSAHRMNSGRGWTALQGTFDIQGNRGNLTAISGFAAARVNAGFSQARVTQIIRRNANGWGGIWGHAVDNQNYLACVIRQDRFDIFERVANVATQKATLAVTNSNSDDWVLEAEFSGATARVRVDGGPWVTHSSVHASLQESPWFGIYGETVGMQYDEFQAVPI